MEGPQGLGFFSREGNSSSMAVLSAALSHWLFPVAAGGGRGGGKAEALQGPTGGRRGWVEGQASAAHRLSAESAEAEGPASLEVGATRGVE